MKFCRQCSEYYPNDAKFCPHDGAELTRTHDPYLGRTIASRYRLTKRLGSGGMSVVYLANHVMIERRSALKILRDDLSKNEVHRERFLREARAVNRINHPNIVEISDLGEADGVAYLVMEFVDGPTLHQALARGPFSQQRAVPIALQVASALARAHHMGVIHRDLKPENILLVSQPGAATANGYPEPSQPEDLVKLTDFGIAKIIDAPSLTLAEQLFGTPGYIAPEYIEGAPASPRGDLYSLGVILYEMTTGDLPYDGTGAALLTLPLREPPVPPSRRIEGYPPDLEDFVLTLLSRRPEDRPPDAFFVYDELTHLMSQGRASTAPPWVEPPPGSLTPEGTRASFEGEGPTSEDAATMAGGVVTPINELRATPNLTRAEAAGTLHWHEAIAELEVEIASARRSRLDDSRTGRAEELLTSARDKVHALERVSRGIGAQQAQLDMLEAEGRRFRTELGTAIDQLAQDQSRQRAISTAVRARRAAIEVHGVTSSRRDRRSDASTVESAALSAAEENAGVVDDDLVFQIESLHDSLDARNLEHELEVITATGVLEGSLEAIRHLGAEIARALEEAAAEVHHDAPVSEA